MSCSRKIIELDARPSDCIAMATQQKAPIYVSQEVWDEVEDMSDVLRKNGRGRAEAGNRSGIGSDGGGVVVG